MDAAIEANLQAAVKALSARRPEDAIAALEYVLERTAAEQLRDAEMVAAGLMAPAFAQQGDLEEASRWARQALELAIELHNDEGAAHYRSLLAQFERAMGTIDASRPLTDEEIETALDRAEEAMTRGDGQAALQILFPLLEVATTRGLIAVEASAAGYTAQALVMLGRVDDALRHATRALDIARQVGDASAIRHFQELMDALAQGSEGADAAVARSQVAEQVREALDGASAALDDGRQDEAIAMLEAAVEAAVKGGATAAEGSARGLLAQALVVANRRPEARPHVNRALEIASALGDTEAIETFGELLAVVTGFTAPEGSA